MPDKIEKKVSSKEDKEFAEAVNAFLADVELVCAKHGIDICIAQPQFEFKKREVKGKLPEKVVPNNE